MPYEVHCRNCNKETWASNIVELFKITTDGGRFKCSHCDGVDTHIYRTSKLQEKDWKWERWIKGAVRIETNVKTYSPYVFLTADSEDGEITGFHFEYYKDTRPEGGKLKHGSGPGGGPVYGKQEIKQLLLKLNRHGVFSKSDFEEIIQQAK